MFKIVYNKGALILQWLKVMWTLLEREAEYETFLRVKQTGKNNYYSVFYMMGTDNIFFFNKRLTLLSSNK